jgi:hypothetical protein
VTACRVHRLYFGRGGHWAGLSVTLETLLQNLSVAEKSTGATSCTAALVRALWGHRPLISLPAAWRPELRFTVRHLAGLRIPT